MKIAWLASLLVAACGNAALPPPATAHVDVPEQPPQTVPVPTFAAPTPDPPPIDLTARPDDDDTPGPFTGAWSVTFNHLNKYAVARQNMQSARNTYTTATTGFVPGAVPPAADFEKANAALELLNRRYAAVYYAPDATDEERAATLADAASTLLDWASRLDAVGLDELPKTFRTNRAIALTFEDVVSGPAKRWRSEGLALANACLARAKASNVATASVTRCGELVKKNASLPTPPHARTKPECACNPGDPLCSATMSGWCKPK